MISIISSYVIVDDYDQLWLETLSSSRQKVWERMSKVCSVPKKELLKRGFKCVRVEIQTEEYQR